MKPFSSITIVKGLIISFLFSTSALSQQLKIAAVDMSKVFNEYYKTKKADTEIKDRAAGFQKEFNERSAVFQKIKEDYKLLAEDAENHAFTEEKRNEKRKALDAKLTDLKLADQDIKGWLQNRDKELSDHTLRIRTAIFADIFKVVQDRAKKRGLYDGY